MAEIHNDVGADDCRRHPARSPLVLCRLSRTVSLNASFYKYGGRF